MVRSLASTTRVRIAQEGEDPIPEARWFNSLGEEVDLDNIDREYALNILSMVLLRHGRDQGYAEAFGYDDTPVDLREDPLVNKLREVVLTGREKNLRDRARAVRYNMLNKRAGKPFRAPVR